jgi:uncharacterized protein YndB with AHSA1/START domain
MANVDMSVQLNAPAAKVWALIGGFDALPRWHPAVASSTAATEGGATLRRLDLHGGGTIVEALEHRDDGARRYSYTIRSGPLPVANYRSELSVEEQGAKRCRVHWSSRFEPDGVPEPEAVEAIRGVYRAGLDSLEKRFGR